MKTVELEQDQWSMIRFALIKYSYQLVEEGEIDDSRAYRKIFDTLHQKIMHWRTEETA